MNKEQSAIVRMALAGNEVKRLSVEIGDALRACNYHTKRLKDDEPYTHLGLAYAEKIEDQYSYSGNFHYRKMRIDEVTGALSGWSEWHDDQIFECPHCLKAHLLIQDRKAARIKLGHARRALTIIGRKLIKEHAE